MDKDDLDFVNAILQCEEIGVAQLAAMRMYIKRVARKNEELSRIFHEFRDAMIAENEEQQLYELHHIRSVWRAIPWVCNEDSRIWLANKRIGQ